MRTIVDDPVDVQLGDGTAINRAIAHCQGGITAPTETVSVLISDLYEGAIRDEMPSRVASMIDTGVTVVALLALSDGAPSYDAAHADE